MSGANLRARHREIARRYKRARPAFSMAALRCAEINRLLASRYGQVLPDDDAGRDDALIMAHHLARLSGDPRVRIGKWLDAHAPWAVGSIRATLLAEIDAKPLRWRADKLGARLRLTEGERSGLRIRTIGAVDVDKAERAKRRSEKRRALKEAARRAAGASTRAEYEAASIEQAQPWIIIGISRRTWYRRRGTAPGLGERN